MLKQDLNPFLASTEFSFRTYVKPGTFYPYQPEEVILFILNKCPLQTD